MPLDMPCHLRAKLATPPVIHLRNTTHHPLSQADVRTSSIRGPVHRLARKRAGSRCRQSIDVSSLKTHRGSDLMRDRLAHWDPLFASSGGAAMRSCYRSVHAPQIVVNRFAFVVSRTQSIENRVDRPIAVPLVIQPINRSPMPELLRKVTPGCTCSEYPENATHGNSRVGRRSASRLRRREKIRDTIPLIIRKLVTSHESILG